MQGLCSDVSYAIYRYRRTPHASLIAIAVLATGFAFFTAFLSLYSDLVMRPHPGLEDSGHIVTIGMTDGKRMGGIPQHLVDQIAEGTATLEVMVGVTHIMQEFGMDRKPIMIELVTQGYFRDFRPYLLIGRGFESTEHQPDAEPVVVLSHQFWLEEFGGDPNVLGTTIAISTKSIGLPILGDVQAQETDQELNEFRVIGVMHRSLPGTFEPVQLWMPFERAVPLFYDSRPGVKVSVSMRGLGRVRNDSSATAVALELNGRYTDVESGARAPLGQRFDAVYGITQDVGVQREASHHLRVFLAGSILLALVAASNMSLFLLAHASDRGRELGIRMAVGAPLKRLARQLSHEAGVLVAASAALGVMLGVWLNAILRNLSFLRQAEWSNVRFWDWRVLTFVTVFMLILALIVSIGPVLSLKRLGIAQSSHRIVARATPAQTVAGTVQLAIGGAFASAAFAFAWYLGSMGFGYPGYETEDRFVVTFESRPISYDWNVAGPPSRAMVDVARHREAILAIPGVSAVAFGAAVPGLDYGYLSTIPHPLNARSTFEFKTMLADEHYVGTLGLRLAYGQGLSESDSNSVLVNQTFARQYFGREDVVGESLSLDERSGRAMQIVGVLDDLSYGHPSAATPPVVLISSQGLAYRLAVIESSMSLAVLQQRLQDIVEQGELQLIPDDVATLAAMRRGLISTDRARGFLTIGAGILVLLLAGFGTYGMQRHLVRTGRRGYAIRASLGAGPGALSRLVFARALSMSAPGLVLGTVLAFITVAWLRGGFVSREISPAAVAATVLAGLAAVVLIASLGPSREARYTQPATLLRED